MKEKKRKIMIEIDRSLGRRLDIYIECQNNMYRDDKDIEKVTKNNIIQDLLTEKLRDLREVIIDKKRAYYAMIERKEHRSLGKVLFSHSMINFEASIATAAIDYEFKEVILRHEAFVKTEGDSYLIID